MMRRLFLLVGALVLTTGCSHSYDVELASKPPIGVRASNEGILMSEGLAILVRISDTGGNDDNILLVSDNPAIVDVYPSTEEDEFVVIGHSIGATTLHVELDGSSVRTLRAEVVAQ